MPQYHDYVCLDLETTGLEPQTCDIIEVAMIKVRDQNIVDRMETFVFTPLEISEHVSYLTGITAKDIENAPDLIDLREKIQEFIGDDPLMGHNIWFDWNFLVQKGLTLENNPLWDTYIMSNILYPELPSHSLETNTKYFGIGHEDSHRAMADVMACYELWQILMNTFPSLDDTQKEQLLKLQNHTKWPMMEFFLQDKEAHKTALKVPQKTAAEAQSIVLPQLEDVQTQMLHCFGYDPADIASHLPEKGKTLYIAGYEHTRNKVQNSFTESVQLGAPFNYLDHNKMSKLWEKQLLEDGETTLLLKTILYPHAVSQDELVLSHPERPFWRDVQTDPDQELDEQNAYHQAYKKAQESRRVIVSHAHVLNDLDFIEHFDQLVVLEPQLLEDNASRAFGEMLGKDQWMRQSVDSRWMQQGEMFFGLLEKLGQSLVPASPYPEHVTLTELITTSNEFIRLHSAIKDIVASTQDQDLLNYLKYYQAFFQVHESSWMRWITVDPRRGVMMNIMPLSVKVLLKKHLFDRIPSTVISNTVESFSYLPEMQTTTIPPKHDIEVVLPDIDLITGTKQEGDHQALISYLCQELPKCSGKTAVIFSSKTALKRYFFDVAKVMPNDMLLLGEDISGGTGKMRDRYFTSEANNKVVFMTYRNLRVFSPDLLDFETIFLQSFPFDPPGLPSHQLRSAQCKNAFMEYAMPRTEQNILEIASNFTKREAAKKLIVLDRRAQEKDYGQQLLTQLQ